MSDTFMILTVNPGNTGTKVGLFENNTLLHEKNIPLGDEMPFELLEQIPFRTQGVLDFLAEVKVPVEKLDAVSGRGGPFPPMNSGTYAVDQAMLDMVMEGRMQVPHTSGLGCIIADRIAGKAKARAFIVDPVSVDELSDAARLSGHPAMWRHSLSHALNMKYVVKRYCREHGLTYETQKLVVAHLGSGFSVSAHRHGKMVDVNNAMDGGPFAPNRCGGLPTTELVNYCFHSGKTEKEIKTEMARTGGVMAYLGTDDMRKVGAMANDGDTHAKLVIEAMIHQTAKEIGAMAVVAGLPLDGMIITGALAWMKPFVEGLRRMVEPLGEMHIYPGEGELEALADGALRVLRGEEEAGDFAASLLPEPDVCCWFQNR